jgi:hypothetical protein
MLGYSSYGSNRGYATRSAKRYASDMIATAWAHQESSDGRCPASMSFEGQKFYSYQTVIAERIEDDGRVVFLVSEERYSSTTGQHLYHVTRAIGSRKTFTVPGVSTGSSNLADMPRILSAWQAEAERKVKEAGDAQREVKRSRLLVEAFEIFEKMRAFAEYFHLSLRDYPVRIPLPHQTAVSEATFARLVAMKLGADPSPWMNVRHHAGPDAAALDAAVFHQSTTAAAEGAAA